MVVIAGIVVDTVTCFLQAIVVAAPDFFFFDRSYYAFYIGVIVWCVVARVLALYSVFAQELDEVFRGRLGAVVTP